MADVSVVWAILAEQGAAANPYPLRSWGCADLLYQFYVTLGLFKIPKLW